MTADEVARIRERYASGESGPSIARDYGIVPSSAWRIAVGGTHRDVPLLDVRHRVANRRVLRGDEHPLRRDPSRAARGSAHPLAKLDEARVVEIRTRHRAGESTRDLACAYGVTPRCIDFVVLRVHWRHVVSEAA